VRIRARPPLLRPGLAERQLALARVVQILRLLGHLLPQVGEFPRRSRLDVPGGLFEAFFQFPIERDAQLALARFERLFVFLPDGGLDFSTQRACQRDLLAAGGTGDRLVGHGTSFLVPV
jgi:hypothetical protein